MYLMVTSLHCKNPWYCGNGSQCGLGFGIWKPHPYPCDPWPWHRSFTCTHDIPYTHPRIKFQWLSATTMLTSFLPLLKILHPQKMIKGGRLFWKTWPMLSQKAGIFARTTWRSSLRTCQTFVPFYSSYKISMGLKLVFIYRPSLNTSN